MLLQDVAGADHHPRGLDPVKRSALLLLHQNLSRNDKDGDNGYPARAPEQQFAEQPHGTGRLRNIPRPHHSYQFMEAFLWKGYGQDSHSKGRQIFRLSAELAAELLRSI